MAMEVQIWSRGNAVAECWPRRRRRSWDEAGACATQIKNSSIFNAYSVKAAPEVEGGRVWRGRRGI